MLEESVVYFVFDLRICFIFFHFFGGEGVIKKKKKKKENHIYIYIYIYIYKFFYFTFEEISV